MRLSNPVNIEQHLNLAIFKIDSTYVFTGHRPGEGVRLPDLSQNPDLRKLPGYDKRGHVTGIMVVHCSKTRPAVAFDYDYSIVTAYNIMVDSSDGMSTANARKYLAACNGVTPADPQAAMRKIGYNPDNVSE